MMPDTRGGTSAMSDFLRKGSRNFGGGRSGMNISSVRVTDVILNSSHPKYEALGREDSIGTIFFSSIQYPNNPNTNSNYYAIPLLPNISHYPLINELVPVLMLSSPNASGINSRLDNKFYYLPPVNCWNNPHHNAVPSDLLLSSLEHPQDYSLTDIGFEINKEIGNYVSDTPIVGTTFAEQDRVHPLQPYEGDIIYEGRWGNSIRFSSTSEGVPPPNWSRTLSPAGDPITILRNGQPSTNDLLGIDPWAYITEDINLDKSSIYLTTTQTIPLKTSTNNSSFAASDVKPIQVDRYNQPQVILSSGRLVLNAKDDSIILTTPNVIQLSGNESVNINGNKQVTVAANNVYLGTRQADQQLILGNKFMGDFKQLLELLQDVSNTLSLLVGVPPGAPLNPNLTLQATNLASKCAVLSSNLNSYLSTTTKTS